VDVVVTNITCNGDHDGMINLTVTGGIGPYTYLWDDGPGAAYKSNLAPGFYQVTVTDAHGCQVLREPTGHTTCSA